VIDFAVQLQRPASIRGKFVMENGEPLKGPTLVFAEPADGNVALGVLGGRLAVMDTFDIQGLLRGQYVLRFPVIANKSVVSVIADGEDYRDKPLDFSSGRDLDVVVNLTDKKTRLWGTTVDRQGMPVKNALVLAFPVERDQWTNYGLSPARLKQTPTSSSGAYDFPDLPAGTYYVVAVSPDQDLVWQDPESLARLAPSASRVSLAWGDVKTQRVTVVKVP